MRTLRRRAAVGATTVALLFAAAGTSLAAVRATRYEGGVAGAGLALPATKDGVIDRDRVRDPAPDFDPGLAPTAETPFTPDGPPPSDPGLDPSTGLPLPAPETPAEPGAGASPESPGPGTTQPEGGPAATDAPSGGGGVTESTLGPASGPTPTRPIHPSVTIPCPPDEAGETLHHPTGRLDARDLRLPSPGLQLPLGDRLVLLPQASATRPAGAPVRIAAAGLGSVGDGSTLTLPSPLPTPYELESAGVRDSAWIHFVPGAEVAVEVQACRDRPFVLHRIGRGHGAGQLRILGFVAPPGVTVTIGGGGGTAHVLGGGSGTYRVALLTATDGGDPGPLVRATITLR